MHILKPTGRAESELAFINRSTPPSRHCPRATLTTLVALLTLVLVASAADKPAGLPAGYKLLYEQKFDTAAALKDFALTAPKAWQFAREAGAR